MPMSTGLSLSPIPEPLNESEEEGQEHTSPMSSPVPDSSEDDPSQQLFVNGTMTEQTLEEGACVCFFTPGGQLLVARPAGKIWELRPIAVGETSYDADGNRRLQFYPPEAIFIVMKRGSFVGFRSLAADGKTLQAVSKEGAPHRINNYNFADWESWDPATEDLMNVKWKKKALGYTIKEVKAVAVEDLKGAQKSHLRTVRSWQTKAGNAEFKVLESERKVKEVLRSSQRQQSLHSRELSHVREQLDKALQEKQKRNVKTLQTGAALNQVELRLQALIAEKNTLEAAASHAESKYKMLQREMELIRERHDGEMHRLELAHSSEMNAITREKELELKHAKQEYDAKLQELQRELDSKEKTKVSQIEELEGQVDASLREKDQHIAQLLDECHRLHAAIEEIKYQVEQARLVKASIEAGNVPITLSPSVTPTMPRISPCLRTRSRGPSRSSSHSLRSGRLSADAVLCVDPIASPVPSGYIPHGHSRFQPNRDGRGTPQHLDRSGARAPTPMDPVFFPKDGSPTSMNSEANPPGASDNDTNATNAGDAGPSDSFPKAARLRDGRPLLNKGVCKWPNATLRSRRNENEDKSVGSRSANEDEESMERKMKMSKSVGSGLEKVAYGAENESQVSKREASLCSFPVN